MGKIRVHELAKELNIESKLVLDVLKKNGHEISSNMSGLDEAQVELVKKAFTKKSEPTEKSAPAEKPKKKNIAAVFNPQNSKTMKDRKPERIVSGGERKPRPDAAKRPRPEGERPEAKRPVHAPSENTAKPEETRKPMHHDGGGTHIKGTSLNDIKADVKGPIVKENIFANANANKTKKPADKQVEKIVKVNRPDNRGNSGFNKDNRGNGRFDKNRQGKSEDAFTNERVRPGRGNAANGQSKPGKDAGAASMESSKKDTRRKNQNNQAKNYDKLGGKKQERFVNLEKQTGHKKRNATPQAPSQTDEDVIKTITLPERIVLRDLADKMKVQASALIKKLFLAGKVLNLNSELTFEEAEEIALEYEIICEPEEKVDVIAELLKEEEEDESKLKSRPPVVCVMGHVDHGKTSLLDKIRHTKVTDKEAGGITQAIGAYVVTEAGKKITFLDTPGHEAFTAMRMRGANSTDIAILVVAADDGVMPQTIEAINHAKAAGVEIIVAVNKIDKPAANIERVKQELSEHELIPEDWGGSTVFCPVSAKTGEGIDNLLDMILLTADVLELKANPNRLARGLVIEAQLDKGRGAVSTMLVQKGTLKVGQPIACGSCYGKIRAMIDDKGNRVKEAGPSVPVEILGLNNVPEAGETFVAFDSEKEAKAFADTYIAEGKNKLIEDTKTRMSLGDLFDKIQSGNLKELNIIVKADVQGSVEAVKQSLEKLTNEEVVVKVIHGGVGNINESDVILASASNAIIIGFNVKPDPVAKQTAEHEGVDIRLYDIIYKAIEDVEAAMKGMLDPVFEEKVLGHAEVRMIFKASGVGNIAGSYVLDGTFERGCMVRVMREGNQIFEGNLSNLKRFKDDVKEVRTGFECGITVEGFNDFAELDIIEAYKMVEVPR